MKAFSVGISLLFALACSSCETEIVVVNQTDFYYQVRIGKDERGEHSLSIHWNGYVVFLQPGENEKIELTKYGILSMGDNFHFSLTQLRRHEKCFGIYFFEKNTNKVFKASPAVTQHCSDDLSTSSSMDNTNIMFLPGGKRASEVWEKDLWLNHNGENNNGIKTIYQAKIAYSRTFCISEIGASGGFSYSGAFGGQSRYSLASGDYGPLPCPCIPDDNKK
jgi:hypothetical protein